MTDIPGGDSSEPGRGPSLPLVAISILNWNGWRDTLKCLESIRQLDYPNFLTVVADNASRDDSAERIKIWAHEHLGPGHILAEYESAIALHGGEERTEQALEHLSSAARMVLLRNRENLGFAGGNNVTIQYALARKQPADFVFLLNNDAVVMPDSLTRLVDTIQKANAGIAEAAIFLGGDRVLDGPWIPPRWQILLERLFGNEIGPFLAEDNFQEVIAAHGSAMLMRSEMLRAVFATNREYLQERFFMYLEDVGISVRARKLGYRCIRANDAVVWHEGAASAGGKFNRLEYYYSHRNALLLAKELSGAGKLITRVIHLPGILGRTVKCILRRRAGAARAILAGFIDGYRGVGGKWKRHDQEVMARAAKRPGLKT